MSELFYPCIKWLQNIYYICRRIKMPFDAWVKRFGIAWFFINNLIRVCRSRWTVRIIHGVAGCGVRTKRSVRTVLTGIVPYTHTYVYIRLHHQAIKAISPIVWALYLQLDILQNYYRKFILDNWFQLLSINTHMLQLTWEFLINLFFFLLELYGISLERISKFTYIEVHLVVKQCRMHLSMVQ